MDWISENTWPLFIIAAEIVSWLSLLLFLVVRYAFRKFKVSLWFLALFVLLTLFEGWLAWLDYQRTGEMATVQVVIILVLLYACTFGIGDFRKMDRWVKSKVGKWRGEDLLTEKDKEIMEKQRDPRYQARSNRRWWYVHVLLFAAGHLAFWMYSPYPGMTLLEMISSGSWFAEGFGETRPFGNETLNGISALWTVIFVIDTIVSLSYTLFPSKPTK